MNDVWEPWTPQIGQRVRVRLSMECQAQTVGVSPPPSILDDQLRSMVRQGVDVASRYMRDTWITGHPPQVDGVEGVVASVDRRRDMVGHFYRVLFEQNVEPGAIIGIDLAAIELEPIS